jgi:hypothetical protein
LSQILRRSNGSARARHVRPGRDEKAPLQRSQRSILQLIESGRADGDAPS